jgi:hypothetical protein
MRLFAYEGGLGAAGVRRALFVFVISGGKAGGFAGGVGDGLMVVGDIGGGDGLFIVEDIGVGDDGANSVAMLLGKDVTLTEMKGGLFKSWPRLSPFNPSVRSCDGLVFCLIVVD